MPHPTIVLMMAACNLRGAARDYAEAIDTDEEEEMADVLKTAAEEYTRAKKDAGGKVSVRSVRIDSLVRDIDLLLEYAGRPSCEKSYVVVAGIEPGRCAALVRERGHWYVDSWLESGHNGDVFDEKRRPATEDEVLASLQRAYDVEYRRALAKAKYDIVEEMALRRVSEVLR